LNVVGVRLNLTAVAPANPDPVRTTFVPGGPLAGVKLLITGAAAFAMVVVPIVSSRVTAATVVRLMVALIIPSLAGQRPRRHPSRPIIWESQDPDNGSKDRGPTVVSSRFLVWRGYGLREACSRRRGRCHASDEIHPCRFVGIDPPVGRHPRSADVCQGGLSGSERQARLRLYSPGQRNDIFFPDLACDFCGPNAEWGSA
jgi:hypothetical protein